MPRSFDIVNQSPASVEQVLTAFTRKEYWLQRHEAVQPGLSLESFFVDSDGTVTTRSIHRVGRELLPGVVARLIPGELEIVQTEEWRPQRDRRARGHVSVVAAMGLGSGVAQAWLAPDGSTGSVLQFAARVEVKIPLLGRKLEKTFGADLAEAIRMIGSFTTAWVAEHG